MANSEKFHSATIPDSRLLQGLLGLRGIAALAVVFFHTRYLTGIQVPDGFHFIERDFGYGAQLFFVLSAFSLMHSTAHTMHRPDWAREYLIKRFFRISPLFYMVLAYTTVLIASQAKFPDVITLLLNVFFVFGFVPDSANGLVMAGWTIGVEMIFYALFPVLLMVIKTKWDALIFMLAAMAVSYVARFELHMQYMQYLNTVPAPQMDWSYFTFLPNLFFFAAGILAYRLEQEFVKSGKSLPVLIPIVAIITIGVLLFTEAGQPFRRMGRLDLFIWGFGFGVLCIWQSVKPGKWIANRFFEYLGERSYSIYLLHPLLIYYFLKDHIINLNSILQPTFGTYAYFVCASVVMGAVLVMAEITYRAIEVPGIKLGRKVIETMRGKALQAR